MTETQAKQIDAILDFLINGAEMKRYVRLYPAHIKQHFRIPADEAVFLISLITDIIRYNDDDIVTSYGTKPVSISKNYNTQKFMNDGGCIKWFFERIEMEKHRKEIEELEKIKLKNDIAAFRLTKKQFIWTIGIAIAALITAVVGILLQIFKII